MSIFALVAGLVVGWFCGRDIGRIEGRCEIHQEEIDRTNEATRLVKGKL